MRAESVELRHFEQLYARDPDPWRFASSDYERAKYAATLRALPRERYARALDVGCSIGVLTAALAERCDDLLGIEPVEAALDQARRRCAPQGWVRFSRMLVPADWPHERFDLIVISEVLDYLGTADLSALADRLGTTWEAGGDLVLVHWVGKKKRPVGRALQFARSLLGRWLGKAGLRTEGEASDLLIAHLGTRAKIMHAERNADYRLDVLRRVSSGSA